MKDTKDEERIVDEAWEHVRMAIRHLDAAAMMLNRKGYNPLEVDAVIATQKQWLCDLIESTVYRGTLH